MSAVDDFLNNLADEADSEMGTRNLVVNSTTIPVVWNDDALDLSGVLGGLESDKSATAVAQAADVTSPYALTGKRCTVDGSPWRIERVSAGDVAVTFALVSVNQPG